MPLFDTHAHYDSKQFQDDREEVLNALPAAGVDLVVNPGCDIPTSKIAVELAAHYDYIYAGVGIHPGDCDNADEEDFQELDRLCQEPKVVAIGEIGLDYYWKDNAPKEFQEMVFRRQIEIALAHNLPVIIHDREAHGDSLAIVLEYKKLRGVFHCFSGSVEMARTLLEHGWYLGFDGPITYNNARRAIEIVQATPLDRIVIETDAPYLTPVPFRGRRNDSRNLPYIVEKLAEWKNTSSEEMIQITWENGKRLFSIA